MKLVLPQKKKLVAQATPGMDTLPIPGEVLDRIYQETLSDLNRRCVQGLLGEANPGLLARVQESQARVDSTWREALAGKATLENFRQAVKDWHGAVLALFSMSEGAYHAPHGRLFESGRQR